MNQQRDTTAGMLPFYITHTCNMYMIEHTYVQLRTCVYVYMIEHTHIYIYIYIRPSSHDNGLNPSDFIPGVEHTICYVGQNPNVFSCVFHVLC